MTQPLGSMLGRLLLVLLVLALAACDDDVSQFVFEARIVDGDGGNPAVGTDADTLSIDIAEGDTQARSFDYPVVDGLFDASLEFASFTSPTRLRMAFDGPSTRLRTAPPAFVPSVTAGFLRVVAAPPSSCVPVRFNVMEAPRSDFGMVQSGTFALVVGGTSASDEQLEFLDALEWQSRLFTESFSVSFLGETRAATVGDGQILVLPSVAGPFLFDMLDATNRVTSLRLHDGAGPSSAVVYVPGLGAYVIGGEVAGLPTDRVTLVQPDGVLGSLELGEARSGAVAAAMGDDVLVVGGDALGSAEILVAGRTAGEPVAAVADGTRRGGVLVGDGESRALLMGGTDEADVLRTDTLRFDGCPQNCSASDGPEWPNARLRATVPERSTLVVGGEGSRRVERVRWESDAVAIEGVVELSVPRAGAGAIVYESGAFVVGGGDDGTAALDDFEFCVPDVLEPL